MTQKNLPAKSKNLDPSDIAPPQSVATPPQMSDELLRLSQMAKDNGDFDLADILWTQYLRKALEERRAA